MANSSLTPRINALEDAAGGPIVATASTYGAVKGGKVPGDTTGAAIADGYVGQHKVYSVTTLTNIPGATNQFGNVLTLTTSDPGPGTWLISGFIGIAGSGATSLSVDYLAISDYSGNTTTDHVYPVNFWDSVNASSVGGHFYIPGFAVNLSANKYIKIRIGYASGTPQYRYSFRAVRIA
jgi:hypothetical protein